MTLFRAMFARSAQANHLRHFGESIGYKRSGSTAFVTYEAQVIRDQQQVIQEVGDIVVHSVIVQILATTDAAKGIMPSAVNTDADLVEIKLVTDGRTSQRQVVKVLPSHGAFTRLLVQ